MKDFSLVAEVQTSQQLEEKELYVVWVQGTRMVLHVPTEIRILEGRGRVVKYKYVMWRYVQTSILVRSHTHTAN